MEDHIGYGLVDATKDVQRGTAEEIVNSAFQSVRPKLVEAVQTFLASPVSPTVFFTFEIALLGLTREIGRRLVELAINLLEPEDPAQLSHDCWFQSSGYRRRNRKTRKAGVATLFGTVVLWRRGYRGWERADGTIFPLEMLLGLNHGATPALVDWLGRKMAEAGASQSRVLELLREECGVAMGVKRLRACIDQLSGAMSELRETHQVEALLNALKQAQNSRGSRKPVLSVGRDGITLRQYKHRFFEVATAATVSVYDRAGKRLTTIYLAWPPELGQATMDQMLTELLSELFNRWQGPLPRLAYVADSGSNENGYYEKVLRRMRHPRTGKQLSWQRVVDYYHVSERVWAMATALFGQGTREANGWAHRMLKALKKPSGASRVLHSAASHFHRRKLSKARDADFWKAYNYIQKRTRFLRYNEYASDQIPLGSGVTEAACKTIFTQRLKLSGMRWTFEGANTILNLRVILLSKTWSRTYAAYLVNCYPSELRPYASHREIQLQNAA
jgi:hypothetical protein